VILEARLRRVELILLRLAATTPDALPADTHALIAEIAQDFDSSDLAQRVLGVVASERVSCERREGEGPLHGLAGGAKWRVEGEDPDAPGWEGGYVCRCGEVFAKPVEQGGIKAAFEALVVHEGGAVAPVAQSIGGGR
jgi:hypothetical protein